MRPRTPGAGASTRGRALRVAIVALMLCAPAGCALVRHGPEAGAPATAAGLLDELRLRREARSAMRARGRVRAGLAGMWTREAVIVRRPDALRVDVLSPFGLALALGADGRDLWVWPAGGNVRYEGPASPQNLARFVGSPLAMSDLVDVFMGLPPARTPVAPPTARRTDEGEWEVVVPLADGVQTLWFDVASRQLTRAAEQRGEGPVLRLGFGDYRDGFPYELQVESPTLQSSARLAYDVVELNPALDDGLFVPPAALRVLPLDAAATPPPPAS